MVWRLTKKAAALATAFAASLALAPPALADMHDFIGSWNNADPNTGGITHVVIHPTGGNQVSVHVFGSCHPTDCDWGTATGHGYTEGVGSYDVKAIVAQFNSSFSNDQIILRKGGGGTLKLELYVAFTDGSGRNDYTMTGHLDPAPGWGGGGYGGGGYGGGGPPPPWPFPPFPGGGGGGGGGYGGGGGGPMMGEDCVSFNPATAGIAFVGGAWKFVDGSNWILDFGSNHSAAVQAGNVIQNYHFDQQCFVVRPNASMTYWKSGGSVPGGGMPGSDCIPVNTAAVQAQFAGGAWKVVDTSNNDWLLDYGSNHTAADRAASTIHHYHMSRQCFVNRSPGPPVMQYWLSY